ncbi:MAG: LTA synthase family protein [Clostridia bacterium]|nr:LTA synthase family protein [Clostridia bacterium]
MSKQKRKFKKSHITALILLLGGNLLFLFTLWLLSKYDHILLDQIIYQMKTSAAGANEDLMSSAYVRVILFGILLTAGEFYLWWFLSGRVEKCRQKYEKYAAFCRGKVCSFFKRNALPMAAGMLTVSVLFFALELRVTSYIHKSTTETDFIETHYADPETVKVTFPEEKRNLIYIFLESMETTFADPKAGGSITEDLIPQLSALAKENVHFSNTNGLGGGYALTGSTWTASAMVAQTSGMIVKVPLTADTYGGEDAYIPGLTSIGEVLEKEGYYQTLLIGSDAEFAGRETYFTEHGNYNVVDINTLKADGRLPEDYRQWWGFEDAKLFDFAKEELTKAASQGKPFNFTILTADTHFPDGYLCPDCPQKYDEQYANVLTCSAQKVGQFIDWIKQQPFYENTTIVLSGDHLTMDPNFLKDIDENYTRTVYNCIINAPIEPKQEQNRTFATFDFFPTTLAAMGVEIEGDRLGLGTNLFSDKMTLAEQFGIERLDEELQHKSEFYNTRFLEMKKATDQ